MMTNPPFINSSYNSERASFPETRNNYPDIALRMRLENKLGHDTLMRWSAKLHGEKEVQM
jgi:hypothetical protein